MLVARHGLRSLLVVCCIQVTTTPMAAQTLLLIHGRPGTTDVVGLPRRRELRTTVVGISMGVTMH